MSDEKKDLEEFGLVERAPLNSESKHHVPIPPPRSSTDMSKLISDMTQMGIFSPPVVGDLISAADLAALAKRDHRIVEKTYRKDKNSKVVVEISTCKMSVNLAFNKGPPQWYETMIFGGAHNDYCERYETEAQARIGHAYAVALVDGAKLAPKRTP